MVHRVWFVFAAMVMLFGCGQKAYRVDQQSVISPVPVSRPVEELMKGTAADDLVQEKSLSAGSAVVNSGSTVSHKNRILFGFDSATIDEQYKSVLLFHAHRLIQQANWKVRIVGNTDERGSTSYNMALGQRRAEIVKKALVFLGVHPQQIEAISYGKEQPIDPAHTEEAWAKNRRADILYRVGG